jgi:hypothetical protein
VARATLSRPLLFVVVAFLVTRTAAYAAGVRFNPNSVHCMPQLIEPPLLLSRLLESSFYLHSQPPLFNLVLGSVLKLATPWFGAAMHLVYLGVGLSLSVAVYVLLVRLGIGSWVSAFVAAALSATPAFILYENWLYYEYPVAALLAIAALAVHEFVRRGNVFVGFGFFALLAAVIYIRSIFQLPWLLLAMGLLLLARRDLRRRVVIASALPVLIVVLLLTKNIIVFGFSGTSSWFGMNLFQVVSTKIPIDERERLVRTGTLSRVALVGAFEAPTKYLSVVRPPRREGVPVLDRLKRSAGCWNFNHSVFVPASNALFHDSLTLIRLRPRAYAAAISEGVVLYLRPFNGEGYVDQRPIRRYTESFDRLVLLDRNSAHPAWTILVAYVAAFAYGLQLTYRLLRRRLQPSPSMVALVFAWLSLVYVTLVVSFAQILENGRIRFLVDPLVVVLLAAAVRDVVSRARDGLPTADR